MWAGLKWVRIGSSGGVLWWNFGPCKCRASSWPAGGVSALLNNLIIICPVKLLTTKNRLRSLPLQLKQRCLNNRSVNQQSSFRGEVGGIEVRLPPAGSRFGVRLAIGASPDDAVQRRAVEDPLLAWGVRTSLLQGQGHTSSFRRVAKRFRPSSEE